MRVQRGALRALHSSLVKSGSWSFRLAAMPVAEAAAVLEGSLADHSPAASCYQRQYRSDLLCVLREPACSPLVQLLPAADAGQAQVLLRIDHLAQAFIAPAAAGQCAGALASRGAAATDWEHEHPAHTPPRASRPPRPASASVGGSPAAAGLVWHAGNKQVVANEAAAKTAAAQLCAAPEVGLGGPGVRMGACQRQRQQHCWLC